MAVALEPEHDVQRRVAPVRRHLAAAVARVERRADAGEQHLERRHAELQAERPIAIVGMEPVVAGPEGQAGGDLHRLVAGAADLEEDAALVLELDLLVVELPRPEHAAVDVEQRVARSSPSNCELRGVCSAGSRLASTTCRGSWPSSPGRNYSIGPGSSNCDILAVRMAQGRRATASLGRDRSRESHRDAVAEDRGRRARDAGAGAMSNAAASCRCTHTTASR